MSTDPNRRQEDDAMMAPAMVSETTAQDAARAEGAQDVACADSQARFDATALLAGGDGEQRCWRHFVAPMPEVASTSLEEPTPGCEGNAPCP